MVNLHDQLLSATFVSLSWTGALFKSLSAHHCLLYQNFDLKIPGQFHEEGSF